MGNATICKDRGMEIILWSGDVARPLNLYDLDNLDAPPIPHCYSPGKKVTLEPSNCGFVSGYTSVLGEVGGVYYDGHNGYDWALPANTEILAAASGRVTDVKYEGDYGWTVTIDHLNGYQTKYSHLQQGKSNPVINSCVDAGEVIGLQGSTGRAFGAHLHFRVYHEGRITDPFGWCEYCIGANDDPLKEFEGEVSENLWYGVTPRSIVRTETGFVFRQPTVPNISFSWTAFHWAFLGGPGVLPPGYDESPPSPLEADGTTTASLIIIPDIQRPDGSGLLITTTVTVPGTPSPLDLIFVIDTTGSMWDDIDQVKAQATELADRIAADVADYRLGLVTYRDHPVSPYGDPGDQPSTVVLPLTTDADAAVDAIQSLIVGGGADWSESVYSGLMAAIDQAWRDGAEKAIILLGDAPPHDPEPFTGYTLDDVLVAAYAVDPANIYPILVGSDPDAAAYFEALAEGSEGQLFAAGDADEVVDALLQALQKIAETKTESVVVFPPPPPMPLCSDIGGLQNTFVRAAIPDGAAGSAMVFCRPLVQNRQYIFTGSAAQIGNADALSLGIIHAVDIYTYDPTGATHPFFSAPVDVCLEGPGALYILGASTSPRILTPVATTAVTADGFTCGSIGQPGILMLVEGTGNSAQNPSSLTAECTLTTTHNLKLRSEPNTSSEVLATLRFDTSLTAIEQVPGWFHVQSPMGVGWVSADYVVPSAGCNP